MYSYKGSISFGFVFIPIQLHVAVKENKVSFNLFDKETQSRIQYKKTCVDCDDRIVKQENIIKGYEYEEGKYVMFDDEDFEKIKSKKDKNITIEQFIDLKEIDPTYFEKPYYVVPTGAEKAYSLLLKAMNDEKKAGLAKTVIGTQETLVLIRAKDGEMLLNTLYFHSEIKKNPLNIETEKISASELKLAKSLIEQMTAPFKPEKYKDLYTKKVQDAIQAKIEGKEIVTKEEKDEGNIVDLMEALQLSLKDKPRPRA